MEENFLNASEKYARPLEEEMEESSTGQENISIQDNTVSRRVTISPGMCGHNSLFVSRLGDWTWETVQNLCGVNPYKAFNEKGNPTYLSFFYFHIQGSPKIHLKSFNFGDEIHVASSAYQSNSESIYVLHTIRMASEEQKETSALDIDSLYKNPQPDCMYVENFNRWVSRFSPESNEKLIKSSPVNFQYKHLPKLSDQYPPWEFYNYGIKHLTFLQDSEHYRLLIDDLRTQYQIDITRDINGVGLLYYASYFAIADEAILKLWKYLGGSESHFLNRKILDQKICYLGNADYNTRLDITVKLWQNLQNSQDYVFNVLISRKEKLMAVCTIKTIIEEQIQADAQKSNTNKSSSRRAKGIAIRIAEVMAEILSIPKNKIDHEAHFRNFGLDSISIVEFIEKLSKEFHIEENLNIEFNPSTFFEFSNINTLAAFLNEKLPESHHPVQTSAPIFLTKQESEWIEPEGKKRSPIAIVGMAGIFPGSKNCGEFWENLVSGKNLIGEIPEERWRWQQYWNDSQKESRTARWGGFIEGISHFDSLFFKISPREAQLMDPQHRIFLQTAWHAIEDAGYRVSDLALSKTGVFAAQMATDYLEILKESDNLCDAYSFTGVSHSILANRVSYLMNFRGPSETIDTACSSSLVALHHGVKSIQDRECDIALVGGVNLLLTPSWYIAFSQAGMLSQEGKCKTFDKNANGYVRGEGCGVLVLKSLRDAISNNDHIYGVILGTAMNHGGYVSGLTVPNPHAQADLLVDAYEKASVPPNTVGYIEAHGTGTMLGDPIEVNGLKKAFTHLYEKWGQKIVEKHCGLGSVKTNIGHLEAAAGIAGTVKALLALKHKYLPGIANFQQLNPYIDIESSPFYIVEKGQKWEALKDGQGNALPRRCGISSFGIGGTNAHVVLEEYIAPEKKEEYLLSEDMDKKHLFLFSAQNKERLKEHALQMSDFLPKSTLSLNDVAYTLQIGREVMPERLAVLAENKEYLIESLNQYIRGSATSRDILEGNIKKQAAEKFLVEGEAGKEFLRIILKNQEWDKLARLWVAGIEIDWNLLYPDIQPHRVSLPGYPFVPERHWIEQSTAQKTESLKTARLHPLIAQNTSTLSEQKYSTFFSGEEFYLKDHLVCDQKILPAVAYIEMAIAAAKLSGDLPIQKIRQLCWFQPVVAGEKQVEVSIALYPEDQDIEYEIYSGQSPQKKIHSQGTIVCSDALSPRKILEEISLADIQKRCGSSIFQEECYRKLKNTGLVYGESFQALESLCIGEEEALSFLQIPHSCRENRGAFQLHPSLMDSALQTAVVTILDKKSLFIPFSMEEMEIYENLDESCYVYAKRLACDEKAARFDLSLTDKEGKILIKMKGLLLLPWKNPAKNDQDDLLSLLKKLQNQELDVAQVEDWCQKYEARKFVK